MIFGKELNLKDVKDIDGDSMNETFDHQETFKKKDEDESSEMYVNELDDTPSKNIRSNANSNSHKLSTFKKRECSLDKLEIK